MKFKIQVLVILILTGIIFPFSSFGQEDCDPFLVPFCEPVPLDDWLILLPVAGLFLWYKVGKLQIKAHNQIDSPCQGV